MSKKISSLIIKENSTIKEAMRCIGRGQLGIALIINANNNLMGVVTDRDVRQALLEGKDFRFPVRKIMTTNPVTAPEGITATELSEMFLAKRVNQIPVVDKEKRVVDIVTLSEFKNIHLSAPDITHKEVEIVNKVLATSLLSIGPKIKEFEEKIAAFVGTKYAIGVNSGTSGLHLCMRSLNIKDGDEVITTPFSFIASANCILFERARPVFVDIDERTLCIDPNRIEEKITPRTKAILPVHIFGHPCQMDKIMQIAEKYNLTVIEDACEAIGAEFKGRKVGSYGNVSVFAFYPNKQITTAEGGMIVTDDTEIASVCRSMRNQGRDEDDQNWSPYIRLGYNYRMNELSAALGVVQIGRIEEILKKRQEIAEIYNKKLSKIKGIITPYTAPETKVSWFVYVIRLDPKKFSESDRDTITNKLNAKGIACRAYFPPIHLQSLYVEMFGYKKGDFPITERISSLTLALPFYNNLKERQIGYVCEHLEKVVNNIGD